MSRSLSTLLSPALFSLLMACPQTSFAVDAAASAPAVDYTLAGGDIISISVYQNPDLSISARVSENGNITFPLLGSVKVGGLTIPDAETRIANGLSKGGFVKQPHVSIMLASLRGNQIDVIGQVNKPGRYPLETTGMRLTDALALAGGISATGADSVVVIGEREGKPFRYEVDVPTLYGVKGLSSSNMIMSNGDTIFVDRAPVFYIYGEVRHPGALRLERDMTIVQGVAAGGGVTGRGTLRGIRVKRRDESGKLKESTIDLDAPLQPNDVVYVRESLF